MYRGQQQLAQDDQAQTYAIYNGNTAHTAMQLVCGDDAKCVAVKQW